jgi:hypothetical protein
MNDLTRRKILIEQMRALEERGMGCVGCPGTCCTFEANSMLLTPLEAKELFDYLKNSGQFNQALKEKLQETVRKYRLEPKYPHQRKSFLRKTYTCPFFEHQELGCPLPREIKPYGCLGFDSHHPELKTSEYCYSETELLKKRESAHPEEFNLNEQIRNVFGISWEKAPIPNALLTFADQEQ